MSVGYFSVALIKYHQKQPVKSSFGLGFQRVRVHNDSKGKKQAAGRNGHCWLITFHLHAGSRERERERERGGTERYGERAGRKWGKVTGPQSPPRGLDFLQQPYTS